MKQMQFSDEVAKAAACVTFFRFNRSFAMAGEPGAEGLGYGEGDVTGLLPGMSLPPELARFAEPVPAGWVPLRDVLVFDAERFGAALRGRPAPTPERVYETADVLARFKWQPTDLDRAIAAHSFPKPSGWRRKGGDGPVRPTWLERDLDKWDALRRELAVL